MTTKLDLLIRIYTDINSTYTLKEVKDKARLFYKTAMQIAKRGELEDIWVQVSREWDLNVWDADKLGDGTTNGMQMTLYPVIEGAQLFRATDSSKPVGLTMWS